MNVDSEASTPAEPEPDAQPADEGRWIITASWTGTALLGVSSLGAVGLPWLTWLSVSIAVAMFVAGFAAFVLSYATAVSRSRVDELSVASVYFLTTCAPRDVRRALMGSFVLQIGVALLAASLRPYTASAFAILGPLYGLGLAGLWGARFGSFPPRDDSSAGRHTS